MNIDKNLYLQLREVAIATCNNAYLIMNGEILTNKQYKNLNFAEKLQVVLYYKYLSGQVIKI